LRRAQDEEGEERRWKRHLPSLSMMFFGFLIFIIVFFAIFGLTMLRGVEVGHAKILADPLARTVSGPVMGPAWFIKAPWVNDVDIYYAMDSVGMWTEWKEEAGTWVETARGDYPAIRSLSKDGLEIEVDVLVRWSLNPNKVVELYRRFPARNWKDVAICSIVREEVRDTISRFTAIEVIEQRATIADELGRGIKERLLAEESLRDAIVPATLEVDLRDIDPSIEFIKAIEAKITAEQEKIKAQFEKERIMILANATAAQAIIEAEGFAQAKIIIATSTKEAIRLITEATGTTNSTEITRLYLTLEALKEIAKTGKNVIFIIGGKDGMLYMLPIYPGEKSPE